MKLHLFQKKFKSNKDYSAATLLFHFSPFQYPIFILPLSISVVYDNKREKPKAHKSWKTWFRLLGLNNFTQEILDLQNIILY